ncbi:MAG: DUF4197 domain-containing protein [Cryomorphaceae bacterium]
MKLFITRIGLFISLCIALAACAELQAILKHVEDSGGVETKDILSNEEIIRGLKDALVHGADSAVAKLSVKNGYYGNEALKIFLPKEAKPIYERLEKIPIMDGLISDAVLSVNRAAEDAATAAKPIFLSTIREMTIQEGLSILKGTDTAATHYLRQKTYQRLYNAFKPKIKQSLDKKYVGNISAERSYKQVIDTYNSASLNGMLWPKITNNSLAEHTTKKALNGLFVKVAQEEKQIRNNPIHRVTDILKRVFGYVFEG